MTRHSHLVLLLLPLAAGCGPIRSTVGIVQAEQVLREARELGAEESAPYAIAVAEGLLAKSIEEQGHAEYSTSWALAIEAGDLLRATIAQLPGGGLPQNGAAGSAAEPVLSPAGDAGTTSAGAGGGGDAAPPAPEDGPAEKEGEEATPAPEDGAGQPAAIEPGGDPWKQEGKEGGQ